MSSLLHAGHQCPGSIPELPEAEDLSPAEAKAIDAFIDFFGETSLRALLDGTWQARRSALLHIEEVLQGADGGVKDLQEDLPRALFLILPSTLQHNVASVFHASLQVHC